MFENLFTPSPLIWGGLVAGLIALPIIIHLINMMRHRRVKWAAMEFLLKSYKKNRNWVWLKQLLLLLSRITALLLALFMLAQIGCDNDAITRLTGSKTTHHYVLIDDSFSMQDRVGESTVFERARSTLALIAARARDRGQQRFTILRFSRATRGEFDPSTIEESGNSVLDMNGAIVDSNFDDTLENIRSKLTASELSVGPIKPLEIIGGLVKSRGDEEARIYVLSDFRAKDWQQSSDVAEQLKKIKQNSGAKLELINCVEQQRSNLAIVDLRPIGNVRSVNTPLEMIVSVKNYGQVEMEKIQVKCRSWVYPGVISNDSKPANIEPEEIDIPTVFIESIKPGATESRKLPLAFKQIGKHVVSANIEDKSVAADNRMYSVVDIKQSANVIVIDGHPDRIYSRYFTTSLSPEELNTGINAETRTKQFLRDTPQEVLRGYDVIILSDVDRLDEPSLRNLEQFVAEGGGLAVYMGPNSNLEYYNDMVYRNGEGPLPIPLERSMVIPEQTEERVNDFVPTTHPITAHWLDNKYSLLGAVQIFEIARPPELYLPGDDSDVEIVATVRGNKRWPLIAVKPFGEGRVGVITTPPGGLWNNWPLKHAFAATTLNIENWLAAGRYAEVDYFAGDVIKLQKPKDEYQNVVQWVSPGNDEKSRVVTDLDSSVEDDENWQLQVKNQLTAENYGVSERIGVYEAWFKTNDGSIEIKRIALNANPSDSDLAIIGNQQLASAFDDANPSILNWTDFNPEIGRNQTTTLSKILLIILIAILLGEQALAYLLSYHPKRAGQSPSPTPARSFQN